MNCWALTSWYDVGRVAASATAPTVAAASDAWRALRRDAEPDECDERERRDVGADRPQPSALVGGEAERSTGRPASETTPSTTAATATTEPAATRRRCAAPPDEAGEHHRRERAVRPAATGNGIQSGSKTGAVRRRRMPPEFGRLESTPGRSQSGGLTNTIAAARTASTNPSARPSWPASPDRRAPTCCRPKSWSMSGWSQTSRTGDPGGDERSPRHGGTGAANQRHTTATARATGRAAGSCRGSARRTRPRPRPGPRRRRCRRRAPRAPQREEEREHRHDRLPHLEPGLTAERPQEPRRDRHHDARPGVAEQPSGAPRHRDERGDVNHRRRRPRRRSRAGRAEQARPAGRTTAARDG